MDSDVVNYIANNFNLYKGMFIGPYILKKIDSTYEVTMYGIKIYYIELTFTTSSPNGDLNNLFDVIVNLTKETKKIKFFPDTYYVSIENLRIFEKMKSIIIKGIITLH